MKKHLLLCAAILLCTSAIKAQTIELFKDVNPGPTGTEITTLTPAGGKLFFVARDTSGQRNTWVSDGTTAGTMILSPTLGAGSGFTGFNGKVYFVGPDDDGGTELWMTDGTATNTSILKEINTSAGAEIYIFTEASGKLFFVADDGNNGKELWATDGTSAGTAMVKDINSGQASGVLEQQYAVYNGKLYFAANDGINGVELWATDGTTSGTMLVKDIFTAGDSYPSNLKTYNGKLYFAASDASNGKELWSTDGTDVGTVMVKDILPGTAGSWPSPAVEYNGKLYFFAGPVPSSSVNLWVTDGTSAGTVLFNDSVQGVFVYNGSLLFGSNENGLLNFALYKSDGTQAGTTLLSDLDAGDGTSGPSFGNVVDGKFYFLTNYDDNGANYLVNNLWVTDGTPGGTHIIQSVANQSNPLIVLTRTGLKSYKGSLYFVARNESANYGTELYRLVGPEVGIDEAPVDANVVLYPNPANDRFTVSAPANEMLQRVKVIALSGELLLDETIKNSTNNLQIDATQYAAGIYWVYIYTADGISIQKIVKQ